MIIDQEGERHAAELLNVPARRFKSLIHHASS